MIPLDTSVCAPIPAGEATELPPETMEMPPLPPTRMYHRADKIDARGRVSALCFGRPRAIDMRRASWTLTDAGVTCQKCLALLITKLGAA